MVQKRPSSTRVQARRSKLNADDVAVEARALRQVFACFGTLDFRPLRFGSDESPLIRAFWESFGGWSPFFLSNIEPPEREHARRTMPAQLADYRRSGCKLKLTDLPANYRLLDIDSQGLGLRLTDEDSGPDPVVVELSSDHSRIRATKATYLRTCAEELIELAMRRMYHTSLWLADSTLFPPIGIPLLPHLAPHVRVLEEGVWRLPNQGKVIVLAHASTDALIAWLEKTDLPPLTVSALSSGEHIEAVPGLESLFETRRQLTGIGGDVCRIGRVDGVGFLHLRRAPLRDEDGGDIVVNPRFVSHVPKAWKKVAKAERCTVSGEMVDASPTPPAYDHAQAGPRIAAMVRLRSMLDACVPEHRTGANPIALEDDTPSAVAHFWRTIGQSEWSRSVVGVPPAEGRDQTSVKRLLSRWMQEAKVRDRWQLDPGSDPLADPCFPARWRAVRVRESSPRYDYLATTGGTDLILADESDGTDDPALFEVKPRAPRRNYLPWRYTSYLARKLVIALLERRGAPACPPPSDAPTPLAPLVDEVRVLAPGVWSWSYANRQDSSLAAPHSFVFASMRSFVPYFTALPPADFARLSIPYNSEQLVRMTLTRATMTRAKLEKLGLRVGECKDQRGKDAWVAAGILAGCPVLLFLRHQFGLSLHAEAADAAALRGWAADQGFGVREQ